MYRGINAVAAASAVFNSLRSASRSARLAVLELTSLESVGGLNSFDNLSIATLVSFAAWVAIAARCCVSLAAIIFLNLPRPVAKYTPTERIIKKKKNEKATRHFAFCSTDGFTNLPPLYLAMAAPCISWRRTYRANSDLKGWCQNTVIARLSRRQIAELGEGEEPEAPP